MKIYKGFIIEDGIVTAHTAKPFATYRALLRKKTLHLLGAKLQDVKEIIDSYYEKAKEEFNDLITVARKIGLSVAIDKRGSHNVIVISGPRKIAEAFYWEHIWSSKPRPIFIDGVEIFGSTNAEYKIYIYPFPPQLIEEFNRPPLELVNMKEVTGCGE